VLVVSHDLEVLAEATDRALVLEGGRMRELSDTASLAEGAVPWRDAV